MKKFTKISAISVIACLILHMAGFAVPDGSGALGSDPITVETSAPENTGGSSADTTVQEPAPEPETSSDPVITDAPVETKAPAPTETAEITDPAVTDQPAETADPENTGKPSEPGNTEEPSIEADPTPTATSKPILPPGGIKTPENNNVEKEEYLNELRGWSFTGTNIRVAIYLLKADVRLAYDGVFKTEQGEECTLEQCPNETLEQIMTNLDLKAPTIEKVVDWILASTPSTLSVLKDFDGSSLSKGIITINSINSDPGSWETDKYSYDLKTDADYPDGIIIKTVGPYVFESIDINLRDGTTIYKWTGESPTDHYAEEQPPEDYSELDKMNGVTDISDRLLREFGSQGNSQGNTVITIPKGLLTQEINQTWGNGDDYQPYYCLPGIGSRSAGVVEFTVKTTALQSGSITITTYNDDNENPEITKNGSIGYSYTGHVGSAANISELRTGLENAKYGNTVTLTFDTSVIDGIKVLNEDGTSDYTTEEGVGATYGPRSDGAASGTVSFTLQDKPVTLLVIYKHKSTGITEIKDTAGADVFTKYLTGEEGSPGITVTGSSTTFKTKDALNGYLTTLPADTEVNLSVHFPSGAGYTIKDVKSTNETGNLAGSNINGIKLPGKKLQYKSDDTWEPANPTAVSGTWTPTFADAEALTLTLTMTTSVPEVSIIVTPASNANKSADADVGVYSTREKANPDPNGLLVIGWIKNLENLNNASLTATMNLSGTLSSSTNSTYNKPGGVAWSTSSNVMDFSKKEGEKGMSYFGYWIYPKNPDSIKGHKYTLGRVQADLNGTYAYMQGEQSFYFINPGNGKVALGTP